MRSDNIYGRIAARGGVRFHDILSLEAILGIGVDRTELEIETAGLDVEDGHTRAGFVLGGRATIRPIALFDLYAEYTSTILSRRRTIADAQVGVDLNVTRNVSLFGGYRWWRYDKESSADLRSDIELEYRGPTAGASLKF